MGITKSHEENSERSPQGLATTCHSNLQFSVRSSKLRNSVESQNIDSRVLHVNVKVGKQS